MPISPSQRIVHVLPSSDGNRYLKFQNGDYTTNPPIVPAEYKEAWTASLTLGVATKTIINNKASLKVAEGGCEHSATSQTNINDRNNFTIVSSPVRQVGERALKININSTYDNQGACEGGTVRKSRAEINHGFNDSNYYLYSHNNKRWFGFSYYFASADTGMSDYWNGDASSSFNFLYICQIFAQASPPIGDASAVVELRLGRGGDVYARYAYSTTATNEINSSFTKFGSAFSLDAWNDVVIYYNNRYDSAGEIKIWINKTSQSQTPDYSITGPVAVQKFNVTRIKLGLYIGNTNTQPVSNKELIATLGAVRMDQGDNKFSIVHPGATET